MFLKKTLAILKKAPDHRDKTDLKHLSSLLKNLKIFEKDLRIKEKQLLDICQSLKHEACP